MVVIVAKDSIHRTKEVRNETKTRVLASAAHIRKQDQSFVFSEIGRELRLI